MKVWREGCVVVDGRDGSRTVCRDAWVAERVVEALRVAYRTA